MTNTKPRNFSSGTDVEFDFEGQTYTGTFGMLATPRRGVPTYLLTVDGKVEKITARSAAGQTLRKAGTR